MVYFLKVFSINNYIIHIAFVCASVSWSFIQIKPAKSKQTYTTHSLKISRCFNSMASLLDSVTVTRVFSLPSSVSSISAAPSVSGRQVSTVEFRGLKASRSLVSQPANRRSRFARVRGIVCESKDTTAAVEGIHYSLNLFVIPSPSFSSMDGFLCNVHVS